MCQFFSLVLTKDAAYSGPTDSHTDIMEHHRLKDWDKRANMSSVVKYEVSPPDGDLSTPYSKWKVVVDQDVFPAWYVPKTDVERVLTAIKKIDPRRAKQDYEATKRSARKTYEAIVRPAREAYEAIVMPARKAYVAIQRSAWNAYAATERSARETYEAIERSASEAYEKAITRYVRV